MSSTHGRLSLLRRLQASVIVRNEGGVQFILVRMARLK